MIRFVGLTAVNALSTTFSIESYREKEKYRHFIRFENGKKVEDTKTKTGKGDKKHGCKIAFSPSPKYLGADTIIPHKDVLEWVELMSYLIPKNHPIKIVFEIWDGLKIQSRHKIMSKPFEEIMLRLTDNQTYSPMFHLTCHNSWSERARVLELDKKGKPSNTTKDVKRELELEVVLRYIPEMITKYDSFCNFTNTIQGGVHQDAFDEVFCRMVIAAAKESMNDAQWEKYKPTWDDVRSGLCCVINLNTNAEVGFVGNVKEKIDNRKLLPYLKECITNGLKEYFASNKSVLDAFVRITKANAKARVELQKVKEASQRERIDSFSEHSMKNFIRCNNTGKNDFRELFIVEGGSAGGSASSGCDRDTQAFFLLRGVTKNAIKSSFAEVMENKEWRDLKKVIRAGIGKDFDINKMYYSRINILTDSDIDGYFITLGILAFMYMYMRPVIEAGRLYKVMAPLYSLDDKEHPYVIRRSEITDIFFKKVNKVYKLRLLKNAGLSKTSVPVTEIKKESLYDFLEDTRTYKEKLNYVADISGKLDARFVECVLSIISIVGGINTGSVDGLHSILTDQKFIKSFMSKLQIFYPESELNGQLLKAIVNGKMCVLDINARLIRNADILMPIYNRYGYRIEVQEKDKDPKVMTIMQFMDAASKYNPLITGRFKGLGEQSCRV